MPSLSNTQYYHFCTSAPWASQAAMTAAPCGSLQQEQPPSRSRLCVVAFASTSEAYFGALSKIGEKALHTVPSRSLGKGPHKMCEHSQSLLSFMLLYPSFFKLSQAGSVRLRRCGIKGSPGALESAMKGCATLACVKKLRLSSYLHLAQSEREMNTGLPNEIHENRRHE